MQMTHTILAVLFLIIINCSGTDLEGKGTPNNGLVNEISTQLKQNHGSKEKTGELDSKKLDQEKKGEKDSDHRQKEGVENVNLDKNGSGMQLGSNESQRVQMNASDIVSGKAGEKEKKRGEGSGSGGFPKESKSSSGEECDPSNSCSVEKNSLVACLRVPGNESPDLSLLIQNKGKVALSVTISAPDFIELEKRQIQLREKGNSKVKVSIGNGRTGKLIVLTTKDGNCSLDFRDLVGENSIKEADYTYRSMIYFNFLGRIYSTGFPVPVILLLIMASSIWTCISFARRHLAKTGGLKYQKLDMKLPVSVGGKIESSSNDGWDDSWGDSWDDDGDEEAPKKPTIPVTPSLSPKVASRRFNKDGWKD